MRHIGVVFTIENVTSPYAITGLKPETTYKYRVQAANCDGHVGTSVWSETFSGSYEAKLNVTPGVYMIRLIEGTSVKTQKILL